MILVRYLGKFCPQEIGAAYVLCGTTGITLFNNHDDEIMSISYDILISIRGV